VILFTKGGGQWLEAMADTGADALGLDWTCDIGKARARVGDRVALQGIWIPRCSMPILNAFVRRWKSFWRAMAKVQATSSIWDMVFINTLILTCQGLC